MTALSVVMPVHNALPYLDQSIASILDQSVTDFELVIRDDGSTDGSGEVLRDWARRDGRIKLFHGPRLGPAGSSNWVVRQSTGDVVARMDADDIARPDRFERQLAVLRASVDIVMVGSLYDTIDAAGRLVRSADLWRAVRRGSPFPPFTHPTVMIRRTAFERVGGYRQHCDFWEDLDLFLRLAACGEVAVICEPLISYRLSPGSSRLVSEEATLERAVDKMYRCIERVEHHLDYDSIVAQDSTTPSAAKLDPRTYIARGSIRLWAGRRPAVLQRAWRGAAWRLDPTSLMCILWALWAAIDPTTLRGAIGLVYRFRNVAARLRIMPGQLSVWRPHGPRGPRGPRDLA